MDLSTFGKDGAVQIVVESPRGSSIKLKYDPKQGVFMLSRPLISGLTYPYDWGFVPSTRNVDGDPIDAMVLWDRSSFPGVILNSRLVGALAVDQNSLRHPGTRERNDRLIVVPVDAPQCDVIRDISDVPQRLKAELEAFFSATTLFEGKDLRILGWRTAGEAGEIVRRAAGAPAVP